MPVKEARSDPTYTIRLWEDPHTFFALRHLTNYLDGSAKASHSWPFKEAFEDTHLSDNAYARVKGNSHPYIYFTFKGTCSLNIVSLGIIKHTL